jgi:hypothetical protein
MFGLIVDDFRSPQSGCQTLVWWDLPQSMRWPTNPLHCTRFAAALENH